MNYYNEFDPKAAAWLEELISNKLIPYGHVDTRSILEVRPSDLADYRQCHFFAGIGGWSLALQLAGWQEDRRVWTGSCPCQPYSCAGKGEGHADSRNLWPAFFSLIRQCRPEHVFGEQVASAIGHGWLDGISTDLEGEGYACGAVVLGAHSVGAPHIRQRIYWMADRQREGLEGLTGDGHNGNKPGRIGADATGSTAAGGSTLRMADSASSRHTGTRQGTTDDGDRKDCLPQRSVPQFESSVGGSTLRVADSESRNALNYAPEQERWAAAELSTDRTTLRVADAAGGQREQCIRPQGDELQRLADNGTDGGMDNTIGGKEHSAATGGLHAVSCGSSADVRMGITNGAGRDSRESSTATSRHGNTAESAGGWDNYSIVHCRDGKARRFEPGSFPLAHGLPGRVGLLRGYGNAIVPQVAAEFIKTYLAIQSDE